MMRESEPCALIIGGDVPTQLMVRFLLARDGCATVTVPDVYALTQAPPANMPVLAVVVATSEPQTLATLASLRRRGYHAPTVVLIAEPSRALRREAFACGARDVISLPGRPDDLRARFRVALGRVPRTPHRMGAECDRRNNDRA